MERLWATPSIEPLPRTASAKSAFVVVIVATPTALFSLTMVPPADLTACRAAVALTPLL
ncbi:hypothetical protein ACFQX6_04940 [Streptosporangium lutulentum]